MTLALSPSSVLCRLLLVSALAPLTAAIAAESDTPPAATPAPAAANSGPTLEVLPAGTEVVLELVEAVDAATRLAGERIKLRVVSDVKVGDRVAVPAGTAATGEVIHASPRGGGGRAAELVLTPRTIDTGVFQDSCPLFYAASLMRWFE